MNKNNNKSLRKQFNTRIVSLLVIISLISGGVQGYLLYNKINDDAMLQASMIAQSTSQGITETDLASRSIEHQIDLKLAAYVKRTGERLQGRKLEDITNEDLIQLRDEFGFAGITLLAKQNDVFVNVKSTDPKDIGFTWNDKVGQWVIDSFEGIMKDQTLSEQRLSYTGKGIANLFTAQSGSHTDKPVFYKYSYYHVLGTDYLLDVYIEASEVYQFTQKVGTDNWIDKVKKQNIYAKEIAVLDPRVFADPSLEKELYPPLKKVVHGEYKYRSNKDLELLKSMVKSPKEINFIEKLDGQSLYKMFIPFGDGRVIYIALDYKKMTAPLYNYSFILIISGILGLVLLVMLTTKFFSKIYKNIQQIVIQIKQLESGDFTVKSRISDSGELADLSESTNTMVDSLNHIFKKTNEQASNVQRHALLLETEANHSLEKVFAMSMESTANARETVEEISDFLNQVEEHLKSSNSNEAQIILGKIDTMRTLTQTHSSSTTEMTITLSDLLKSLHGQSSELTEISQSLLSQLEKFKLVQ